MPFQRVRGWCKRIRCLRNCRLGADFLNFSREVRACPLQHHECPKGNSGGTAECNFRPEQFLLRAFLFKENCYGQRITKGLRTETG